MANLFHFLFKSFVFCFEPDRDPIGEPFALNAMISSTRFVKLSQCKNSNMFCENKMSVKLQYLQNNYRNTSLINETTRFDHVFCKCYSHTQRSRVNSLVKYWINWTKAVGAWHQYSDMGVLWMNWVNKWLKSLPIHPSEQKSVL